MRKATSYCANIFHHAIQLCRTWRAKAAVVQSVSSVFESLENRQFFSNSVWLSNGILNIQGSATSGSSLTANLQNGGKSIDASADKGHAIIVPTSAIKGILINGGAGNDYVFVDQNIYIPTTINGGDGNDQIRGGGGFNLISEGSGNDWVSGRGSSNSITVANGNDTLLGSNGNDTLIAGNGKDSMDGAAGNDLMTAGNGNDTMTGDNGNDTMSAGTGKDTINGGLGNDHLTSGNGPSTMIPGSGTNYIVVGGPLVIVVPSAGNNTIVNASGVSVSPATGSTAPVAAPTWSTYAAPAASGTAPRAIMQVMAPAANVGIAVDVRALNSLTGTGSPIDANYQWSFGDAGSQYNTLPGFNASHVYTAAGTYTITLTVTNNLHQSSTVSSQINIGGDNRRAIYVNSATGNDSNTGSTPAFAVKTAARADQLLGNNAEVFFARGQEFNLSQAFKLNFHNVLVGAYGTGAKPVINYTAPAIGAVIFTTNSSAASGVTIQDLTLTTLDGTQPNNTHTPMAVMAGGYDTAVLRCTFYFVEYDVNASAGPVGLTVVGNDSPINGGLQGYFLWDEAFDSTVLGNYVNSTVHEHIIRTSGANELLILGNDFNNYDGKGCIEVHEGSWAWVDGNTVNSGDIRVGPLGLWGEPVTVGTSCCVIQNNYVENTDIAVYPGAHDISIRNNIITRSGSNMIDLIGEDGLGRQSSDIRILSNTGVSTSSSTGQFLVVQNHVDGIVLENNLLMQPNLATGGNLTAPVYVTEASLSSFTIINGNVWQQPKTIYKYAQGGINFVATSFSINGYMTAAKWNAQPQVGNDYFSKTPLNGYAPAGGLALTIDTPIAGVFADIYGKTRSTSGSWTAGAVQV